MTFGAKKILKCIIIIRKASNNMEKETISLSTEQQRYATDLADAMANKKITTHPKLRHIASAPGSGKTTVIIAAMLEFEKKYPNVVDEMLDAKEKILIVVFNTKNKKEILSKVKKAKLPQDLFEISTINSLFYRELSSMSGRPDSKLGSFKVEYTQGFFTKPMISTALSTLAKGIVFSPESAEEQLSKKRLFSKEILKPKNIDAVWSLTNSYFASPYSLSQFDKIEEIAIFFGKKPVSIEQIVLSNEDAKLFDNMSKKTSLSPKQLFFKAFIERIIELATYQEKIINIIDTKKEISFPVVIETDGVNGGKDIEVLNTYTHTSEKKEVKKEYKNIFKVPHSYYYKQFFKNILKDKETLQNVFSKYRAMLVDEGQDNDYTFFLIMIKLIQSKTIMDVSIIGDSLQGIYGFKSPDHFDILQYIDENAPKLEVNGLKVERYSLSQTYRFGLEIAKFTNALFGSNIKGFKKSEDFIFPKEVTDADLLDTLEKTSKENSTAIICRSNQEAARLFMHLKNNGYTDVKLESSIKKEISDFVKNGIMFIEDEHHRLTLYGELSSMYGKRKMTEYSYEDIFNCRGAKKFLINNGHAQLIRFTPQEIQNYIADRDNRSKNITWIGTAHLFKGAEYDYVFVAGDYFKREMGVRQENIDLPQSNQAVDIAADIFADITSSPHSTLPDSLEENISNDENKLKDILCDPKNKEEKNILYVALTRAKKGMFFLESELARNLLLNYNINPKVNLERFNKQITLPGLELMKDNEEEVDLQASLFHKNTP